MKIRNGFVSNSSSSSYLISFKNGEACKYCGRKDADLDLLFDNNSDYGGDETKIRTLGDKDTIEYFMDMYNIGSKDANSNEIIRFTHICSAIQNAISNGYNVAYVDIRYGDEKILDIISNSPNMKILESWD